MLLSWRSGLHRILYSDGSFMLSYTSPTSRLWDLSRLESIKQEVRRKSFEEPIHKFITAPIFEIATTRIRLETYLLLARSTNQNVLSNVLRMVGIHNSRNPNETEWHYLTYEGNDGSCYEFWTPLIRRSHQYHRLDWPSNPERLSHTKFERTPDSSVNKFLPYDFHIFIEKEHWWSIRWRPVGPFNRDAWKAWYTTSSEPWKEFFVLVWNFLPRLPCPSGALGQRMYWWRRQKRTWNRHVAAIWYCLKGIVVMYHSTTAPVDDRADF